MEAKRIIPCLDVKDGRVVKGVKFVNFRDEGDPVELAVYYDNENADELVFLDITASHEERSIMLDIVEETASKISIPLTVGGGIRSIDDMKAILAAGADKVSISSAAIRDPELISKAAGEFGSKRIVVAIDAKRMETGDDGLIWEVYINGGRKATGIDAVKWAQEAEKLGAGEILLPSMDTDGTRDG